MLRQGRKGSHNGSLARPPLPLMTSSSWAIAFYLHPYPEPKLPQLISQLGKLLTSCPPGIALGIPSIEGNFQQNGDAFTSTVSSHLLIPKADSIDDYTARNLQFLAMPTANCRSWSEGRRLRDQRQ